MVKFIGGAETPKWSTFCDKSLLRIVAERLRDGQWFAEYSDDAGVIHADAEKVVAGLARLAQSASRRGEMAPAALSVMFFDPSKEGRDQWGPLVGCGIAQHWDYDQPDHEWNDQWKALAG